MASIRDYNLIDWLNRQMSFSLNNFGPGNRVEATAAHVKKELVEAQESNDVEEWIDIAILAFDQAWRACDGDISKVVAVFHFKQQTNMKRSWPNWKTVPKGQPVEHIRENER